MKTSSQPLKCDECHIEEPSTCRECYSILWANLYNHQEEARNARDQLKIAQLEVRALKIEIERLQTQATMWERRARIKQNELNDLKEKMAEIDEEDDNPVFASRQAQHTSSSKRKPSTSASIQQPVSKMVITTHKNAANSLSSTSDEEEEIYTID